MSFSRKVHDRQVASRGECHLSHSRMRQQHLPVPPEQLLPYLRLELDLDRLKILHQALWSDKGIIRLKQETVL